MGSKTQGANDGASDGHFPKFAGMQGAQYIIKIGHQTHPSQGSRDLGIEGYSSLFFPSLN